MISERLFYFVHGIVTRFFLMAGVHRIGRKNASRLERLSGYILLYWGFLELKDLFFYPSLIFRDNYISNLLILMDIAGIGGFLGTLGVGLYISFKRNVKTLGKTTGLYVTLFSIIYIIGCIISAIAMITLIVRIIVQMYG